VSNFRCLGSTPVEIELDDIVVLVGPNNAGKSSILRAYQVVMLEGDKQGHLTLDDFPDGEINPERPPTIELETVVHEGNSPASKWIQLNPHTGELIVKERWVWKQEGAPDRDGWNVETGSWDSASFPWGPGNIAQANRPRPHRVGAFEDPIKQAEQVLELLKEAIKSRIKEVSKQRAEAEGEEESEYERLLKAARRLQTSIALDATAAVESVCEDLGRTIAEVFPGYAVMVEAKPEDGLDKSLSLFRAELRMGPEHGHQSAIDRQGSGACRTLLWAALRILAERKHAKKDGSVERPHVLLMDEPELCLHPDAIREACRVLYDLPKRGNWQVMITTHSPVFIDFSRDNTSIVRVERDEGGHVEGTTIFRPYRAKLDEDDKTELKLLNICDPYVAEFFFGGRTVIVEGDTEYTAFRYAIAKRPVDFRNVHVVRARGKYPIASLCKILNQFGKRYAVLHDADSPKTPKGKGNPAWAANARILDATTDGRNAGNVRLLASVPDFERAFFGEVAHEEKPYESLRRIRTDEAALGIVSALLESLVDFDKPVPKGALQWADLETLAAAVNGQDVAVPQGFGFSGSEDLRPENPESAPLATR
jgi:putative ATP-dependent endonuclease of OLD family